MHALPACPACGMPRSDQAASCPHCGAPAANVPEGARKSVAVLFADIAGSTPMIDGQDPEAAHALLRPALDLIAACVRRYGGTVNRVTGDGVMALFGAPSAMEDHVLAACCAAVAMQAELPATAPGVALRVGLHAGEVMVHAVRADGAAGLDAAGDAVHLAARLQQAADPGKTLISGTVARAAGARLATTNLAPMRLRGLASPVAVSELTGVAPELTRLEAAGAATLAPFVGRAEELMILAEAMAEARSGRGSVIGLAGEPGIGKSRLIQEFARQGLLDVAVHEATCLRWRETVGFHPLRPLLRALLLLDASTPPEPARARIAAAQADWSEAARDAEAMAAVLDLPAGEAWRGLDPKVRRRRMLAATVETLARVAAPGPALLVIDDLHWADAETLSVAADLAGRAGTLPMLLLLGWRPDFDDPLVRHEAVRLLPLGPLGASDARELAGRLLGDGGADDAARLARRAAGNPLFIESEAAARREQGTAAPLPDTVRALLGARIDRTGPDEKRLMEVMATHGEPAPIEFLAELAELPLAGTAEAAAALTERRLAVAEGVGTGATLACAHALIQDVTYADMTRARRRLLHARVLHVLERRAGDAFDPVVETLSRHARLAEDFPRLVRFARAAGKRAAARNANSEAVRFYSDALDALGRMPGADPALGVDIRFDIRQPLYRMGRIAELRARLEEAAVFAETLGDAKRLGELFVFMSHHAWLAGEHDAALAASERAAALAAREGDAALALRAVFQRGLALYGQERCAEAADCMARVAAECETPGLVGRYGLDRWLAVTALAYQVRTLADLERFDEALPVLDAARAKADATLNPFSMIFVDIAEGWLLYRRGEAEAAIAPLSRALAACKRAEADLMRPVAESFLGAALVAVGRREEGGAHLERAVADAQAMGFLFQQPLRKRLLEQAVAPTRQSLIE
jgi:class 3 adenylate cyclase/tetratricopeptide (TPR) repeat protein